MRGLEVRPKLVKKTIVVHESQVPKLKGAKGKTITNIEEVCRTKEETPKQKGGSRATRDLEQ